MGSRSIGFRSTEFPCDRIRSVGLEAWLDIQAPYTISDPC